MGDTIQYFVLAKDNAPIPNVGTYPALGTVASYSSSNGIVISALPTTPFSYLIRKSFGGTKIVGGTNPDYVNLRTAFADIMTGVLTSNLILSIAGDITDNNIAQINRFAVEEANYTVTVKPAAGVNPTITGIVSGDGLIKTSTTINFIIDGSNTVGGTSRNLTIWNKATTGHGVVIYNNSNNCSVLNTNIKGNSNAYNVSNYGIYLNGYGNNYITLSNNSFQKLNTGIYSQGITGTNMNNYLTITNNYFPEATDSLLIGAIGISTTYTNNSLISGNIVEKIKYFNASSFGYPTAIKSQNCSNLTISKNRITNFGKIGIWTKDSNTINLNNNLIYGNLIYTDYNNFVGLYCDGSGSNYNIYFNTINLTGSSVYNSIPTNFAVGITNINLVNNVLVNSTFASDSWYNSYNTAMYSSAPMSAFTVINNNLYYSQNGPIGRLNNNSYYTFDEFKAAFGQNQQSLNVNPNFVSDTDLRPWNLSPLWHSGIPIPGITTDFLNVTRHLTTPSIGAYEDRYIADLLPPAITVTPFVYVSSTDNPSVTAVITDDWNGVDVATAKPRLYFKKIGDANVFGANNSSVNGWKWVETTSSGSPFNFLIDYTKLQTEVIGQDSIQYFIVAQDLTSPTPRVAANPSAGFSGTSVSNVLSAPTSPLCYSIAMIEHFPFITNFETWPLVYWSIDPNSYYEQTGYFSDSNWLMLYSDGWSSIVSVPVNLQNLSNPVMEFQWIHYNDGQSATMNVLVSTDSLNWQTVWTRIDAQTGTNAPNYYDYKNASVDLSAYQTSPIHVKIQMIDTAGYEFYFDNIIFKEAYTGILSAPVVTISHNAGNLTLNWTAIPNALNYKIYKSATPDGTFTYVTTVTNTSYPIPVTENRAFYRVTATTESAKAAIRDNQNKKRVLKKK